MVLNQLVRPCLLTAWLLCQGAVAFAQPPQLPSAVPPPLPSPAALPQIPSAVPPPQVAGPAASAAAPSSNMPVPNVPFDIGPSARAEVPESQPSPPLWHLFPQDSLVAIRGWLDAGYIY